MFWKCPYILNDPLQSISKDFLLLASDYLLTLLLNKNWFFEQEEEGHNIKKIIFES